MISLVGCIIPRLFVYVPRDARQAPEGAAPPLAPAGEHVVHHRRGPRRRAGPSRARDEGAALPRPLRRGRVRRGRRRARLPPRGRQPGLPPRRDRRARRRRRRQPVRLQGRRHPAQRRRLRLLQQPDAVRRLRPGRALRPRRDGAVLLQHHRLRRRLAHRGRAGRAWRASSSRTLDYRPSRAARTRRTTSRSTTRCPSAAPTSSSSVTATRRSSRSATARARSPRAAPWCSCRPTRRRSSRSASSRRRSPSPSQIGLEGAFYPTFAMGRDADGNLTMPASVFGDALDPLISMSLWTGDLGLQDGSASSVYVLDKAERHPGDEGRRPAVPHGPASRRDRRRCPTASAR